MVFFMHLTLHRRRRVYILGIGLALAGLIILAYSLWIPRYIGGFRVLDDRSLLESIRHSSAFLRNLLIGKNTVPASDGYIVDFEVDRSILYMNHTCILLRLNSSSTVLGMQGIHPDYGEIIRNETGQYILTSSLDEYMRVYHGVLILRTTLPDNALQGVVKEHGDGEDYYLVASIPYIYIRLKYLSGLGNASFIIRLTVSINGRNLTEPYVVKYGSNTNFETILSPVEFPMTESSIMEYREALAPLLEIKGGSTIDIVWYIDVYIHAKGEYNVELLIGYPVLRTIVS